MVWKKIKLHGSQAETWMQNVRSEDWKGTKLQGDQTAHCMACKALLVWKKVKLHGAQTPDVAGTIFEGKWNCMMLKLAFEPEHALEVEETFGCCTFTYFTI